MSSGPAGPVTPSDVAAVEVQLPVPSGAGIIGFAVRPGLGAFGPVAYYTADDGVLRSWDIGSDSHTETRCAEWPLRSGLVLAPGGRAVSRVDDDTLALWRLETGEVERTFVVPPNPGSGWRHHINAWDVDTQGRLVASARDKHVRVWDVGSGALVHDMRRYEDQYFSNSFTVAWVDADHLVTCEERGLVRLWSLSSGDVVESWAAPEAGRLEVSKAGRLVQAVRGQLAVITPGRRRRKRVSGADNVWKFCMIDAHHVVTISGEGVEHRDLDSGRLLGVLPVGLPAWFRSSDPWVPRTYLHAVTPDSVVSVGVAGAGALWFPLRFAAPADVAAVPSAPRANAGPDRTDLPMDLATFWSLVETSRRRARRAADEEDTDAAQVEALIELLATRSQAEIVAFDRHFRDRIEEADTRELVYAAADGLGGSSDDGLLYFRCWLVGLGRRSFDSVVNHPARLARLLRRHSSSDRENFDLFNVAETAWEQTFGGPMPTNV